MRKPTALVWLSILICTSAKAGRNRKGYGNDSDKILRQNS